jgi:hypothetical protein
LHRESTGRATVSFDQPAELASAAHSLYWFNECGLAGDGDGYVRYCIEGVVDFEDLAVERFDGTPVAVEQFAAAGKRWWRAFFSGDPRVSVEAQTAPDIPPPWRNTPIVTARKAAGPGEDSDPNVARPAR